MDLEVEEFRGGGLAEDGLKVAGVGTKVSIHQGKDVCGVSNKRNKPAVFTGLASPEPQ